MAYAPPSGIGPVSAAKRRQQELTGPYFAALATVSTAHREAVEAFVAAVRQEAAARRVATRDNGSRR